MGITHTYKHTHLKLYAPPQGTAGVLGVSMGNIGPEMPAHLMPKKAFSKNYNPEDDYNPDEYK
jgi:hypothetical protein